MNPRRRQTSSFPSIEHAGRSEGVSPIRRAGRRTSVVVAVVLLLALAGCGKKDDAAAGGPPGSAGGPPKALPVTVVEAEQRRIPITIESAGQSEGSKEVQVRARVSGILLKQRFTEGDRVKAGAVMYQIDPEPYRIALAQARATLDQARASSEQAVREAGRLKPLAAEQAVSGKDLDDALSTQKTAAANVMGRQADVRNAELNLGYTQVVAPIGGVTGRNISSEGSLVTVNTDSALLTTISQTDPIWVRFSVTESEYNQLRSNNGDNAKVELLMQDGKPYDQAGKLNFTASTVDRTLGNVQLRAEVPNPTLRILPGQFVKTRLFVGELDGVLVPQVAVRTTDQGKSVMVVGADNKAEPRTVEAGVWRGDQWVIKSGLKTGDKVIIDNLVKVRPGMQVDPHPPQAAGAQPPGDTKAAAAPKNGEASKPGDDSKK